jgi:hypothetical protein
MAEITGKGGSPPGYPKDRHPEDVPDNYNNPGADHPYQNLPQTYILKEKVRRITGADLHHHRPQIPHPDFPHSVRV